MTNIFCESFVEQLGLFFENPGPHHDTRSAQLLEPFSSHLRIGVLHAGDDAAQPGGNDRVCTRTGATLVRAGFEVEIYRGSSGLFSGLLEGEDFGMFQTVVGVRPSADNCPLFVYDDCAYGRIGRRKPDVVACGLESTFEEWFVSFQFRHG